MAKFNYTPKSNAGKTKPSTARALKTSHRKAGKGLSLKEFARALPTSDERVTSWFHNKKISSSKGPLGIGATRKKKNKPGSSAVSKLGQQAERQSRIFVPEFGRWFWALTR